MQPEWRGSAQQRQWEQVFATWPPAIEAFLRAQGKGALPAHDPGCAATAPGAPGSRTHVFGAR